MLVLKQSTSVKVRLGPFVDATDGVTPETGITIAAADQAEVLKANGAATVAMTGTLAAVTGADGWYDYTVQTGDVDTVGEVVFVIQDSSVCLPVFVRAQVVEEATYDFLYASGATPIADINAEVDTALADYDPPTNAELVSEIDSVQADIAALNDISVSDILTTQMTESYHADGTAPTLAQALFAIMQQAGEFSISGTTITVKKLDGSTTAMTFTLDDANNPTSRTRAT